MDGVPSVGVFLRDPSPYLPVFRRKITENSDRIERQAQQGIEPGTFRLPVFECRTTQPLVDKADSLTSMPYPGFEPGTFGAAAGFPGHYTAWSALNDIILECLSY